MLVNLTFVGTNAVPNARGLVRMSGSILRFSSFPTAPYSKSCPRMERWLEHDSADQQ
jgi:hypothetical protein